MILESDVGSALAAGYRRVRSHEGRQEQMGKVMGILQYVLLAFLTACAGGAPENAPAASDATRNSEPQSTSVAGSSAASLSPQQESDSSVSAMIPPEGGTLELSGFAWVTFPEGAFDSARVVTLRATSYALERDLFEFAVGTQTAAHEIRVITGTTAPNDSIEIGVFVPTEFLENVPANKVPVLFEREIVRSKNDTMHEYIMLTSESGSTDGLIKATVSPREFEILEPDVGLQIVMVISTAMRRE